MQAKRRLDTMADYQRAVVFPSRPALPAAAAEPNETVKVSTGPVMQVGPGGVLTPFDSNILQVTSAPADANTPAGVNLPVEANLPAEVNR